MGNSLSKKKLRMIKKFTNLAKRNGRKYNIWMILMIKQEKSQPKFKYKIEFLLNPKQMIMLFMIKMAS